MSRFVNNPTITLVDEFDEVWELEGSLYYESDLLQTTVVVPKGFRTDLASVPRLPFAYLFAGGKAVRAAIVHDWFYSTHSVSRKQADALLEEAMEVCGYGWWTRKFFWGAVRVFGRWAWKLPNFPQEPQIKEWIEAERQAA